MTGQGHHRTGRAARTFVIVVVATLCLVAQGATGTALTAALQRIDPVIRAVSGTDARSAQERTGGPPVVPLPPADPDASASAGDTEPRADGAEATGVVLVETTMPQGRGAGTGVVLSSDGTVVTNYHVVEGSSEVTVTVATSGQAYAADVVGHDETLDVAVLQLRGASGLQPARTDDSGVDLGEAVTKVGNAGGQGYLTTDTGRVTDTSTRVTARDSANPSDSETLTDVFATTVGAQPGDSGGPMLDADGEVVGLTTAGNTGGSTDRAASQSFAVDIADALDVADRVRAGDESGTVQIGPGAHLGVLVTDSGDGLAVAGVTDGMPAAQAGIEAGDTIAAVDGERVTGRESLAAVLDRVEPGERIALTWVDPSGTAHRGSLTTVASPLN